MHSALGRLRGRTAPREDILDRIAALRPTFKVHWHPWQDGAWYWLLANHIGTPVLEAIGAHALQRLGSDPKAKAWEIAGAELMLDRGYIVHRFTEDEFGGEHMLYMLDEMDRALDKADAEEGVERRVKRLKKEWELAQGERLRNQAYKAYLEALVEARPQWVADQEALLKEAFPYYMREARSVVLPRAIPATEVA